MKVMKFGGTSVGTVESLQHVKRIVESESEPVVVVVSALGGITDRLIRTADLACACDATWHDEFDYIVARHKAVADGLVPDECRDEIWTAVSILLSELEGVYRGIELVNDVSPKVLDRVVSFGERMSSTLISAIISDATLLYSPDFIRTERWYNKHIPVDELTRSLILGRFMPMPSKVVIAPGFISGDRDTGALTNLGRGGSDYTAAIIAAALDASILEIWTDVDGFMSADPRVIPTAHVLPRLSFVESMDLCSFGAKVIYPPTIYPVFRKKIPIVIKNTFNSSAPGTFISDEHCSCSLVFRGISSIKDVNLFSVSGESAPALSNRIFTLLTKNGVEVLLAARPATDESPVTFAIRDAEAARAEEMLRKEFESELATGELDPLVRRRGVATVSVVGENLRDAEGVLERLGNTLMREGIDVFASAPGPSGITMTLVVDGGEVTRALKLLHAAYLEN